MSLSKFLVDKYDVNSTYGFADLVNNNHPLYFIQLNNILDKLNTNSSEFCKSVDDMPDIKYDYEYVVTNSKYLYSVTSIICHKYIWCQYPKVNTIIPKNIGLLWHASATALGLPTVLTHSAIVLFNWYSSGHGETTHILENLKSKYLMTGMVTEDWFYRVMLAMECVGGSILSDLYMIDDYIINKNTHEIINVMNKLVVVIDNMTAISKRMYEQCDPKVFFTELRQYLSGSDSKEYFPDGLSIADSDIKNIKYLGGSAAQSTLIQVFDVVLDVKHDGHAKYYLDTVRQYMPQKHRLFLHDISLHNKLADYCLGSIELTTQYNSCIISLAKLRASHFKLVHDYIIAFKNTNNVHNDKGTGGTNPVKFLGEIIKDTTKSTLVETTYWPHRFLWKPLLTYSIGIILVILFVLYVLIE